MLDVKQQLFEELILTEQYNYPVSEPIKKLLSMMANKTKKTAKKNTPPVKKSLRPNSLRKAT